LQIWGKSVKNGHIKRLTDDDIQSSVLEIAGTNVSTTYITCPNPSTPEGTKVTNKKKKHLGIKLPFLVMIIKNVSASACLVACWLAVMVCGQVGSSPFLAVKLPFGIHLGRLILSNLFIPLVYDCSAEEVLHFRSYGFGRQEY